jgi:growth hormone secretagogue receptor
MENVTISTDNVSSAYALQKPVSYWIEYKVAVWLVKYFLITFIAMGTIGNSLSLLVLVRRRMRSNSVNFYLSLLACADTAVLCLSGFKTWLRVVTGFELLHVSDAGCKITIFLFMLMSHLSAWLIVLVTADRFIVVWFPFTVTRLCSLRRSRMIGFILLIVLILYNMHLFWTMHLYEVGRGYKQCAPLVTNTFMNGPYNYIRLASYSLIPFALVIAMNAGIIACICQSSRRQVSNIASLSTFKCQITVDTRLQQRNKQQVTIMLLIVSFSWLVLTMPYAVFSLINFQFPNSHSRAVTFLAKTVSFLLMYLNHSYNFFLYCIAGKKFRKEFIRMFKDWGQIIQCRRSHTHSINELMYRTSRQKVPHTPETPAKRMTKTCLTPPVGGQSLLMKTNHRLQRQNQATLRNKNNFTSI